ncbi:peptide/nickel transport system substrate-binding protein [Nocardioides exalbidus]|uniref:Peptide/nickel transport system substrate-binding protein n=1 Tax=Nocardioides exalbidus TaxID=402596 RepID=A0A1H4URV2_9ACTN|nr:ABC transporter substrate-binding protein [Nocardioides exalbidus]SEC71447.1 peptide/nickel transport system substrate-binding protein [Nocardioides exalbidus]
MNQNQAGNWKISRRQMLRYSGVSAVAVGGSSFLAGCGGGDGGGGGGGGGGAQSAGGQLIHGATGGGAKDTLDPHQPVTAADIARCLNLYEPLLIWDNNYELQPALAESVEPSKDAITWTVKMRSGATFHNGAPVTAEDAWLSIRRVADPKAPLSAGGQLSQIIDFESSKVVDDTTLKIVLNTPYAILDSLLAEYTLGIIPGGKFDPANPVGTAGFAYKSFEAGKTSTFTKYADYWGDAAFLDELVIQDFADDNAKVNALQAGQIQTLDNLPYNLVDTIKGAGAGVLTAEGGQWVPFTMRVDQAPFNDPKVRQAMRLIVDRQAMIDQTLSGYGSLGNDMYAPLDVAYASDLPQREQDIDQAKSLLASAGADGLQVELFTGDDIGSVAVPAANLFAEQAKAAGVDVKVTKKTPFYDDDYLSYTFAQDFWNTRNYIPQAVVGTFPPDQGGTYNETHWDNADHRDLVNAAAKEVDEAKRATLLHDAQEIEYDEGGYIIWGFRQQVDAYGSTVQGLEPSKYLPLGNYNFRKVSL